MNELLEQMTAAWASGDGEAYGACFTEDATYVTFVGTLYQGRAEIARSHDALFKKFLKGSRLAYEIVSVRQLSEDVTLIVTRGDVQKGHRAVKLGKVQTYTLVRQADGKWLCAAFHNTQHKALMEAVSFKFAPETIPAAARS
jgi:uncharacterized protein (TIGR02246 family)